MFYFIVLLICIVFNIKVKKFFFKFGLIRLLLETDLFLFLFLVESNIVFLDMIFEFYEEEIKEGNLNFIVFI